VQRVDVIVVGGGPGGSSLAWGLRDRGLDVLVVDRKRFPRDKICAGWVTPPVFECLDVDLADYAKDRVLQPIQGFAVGRRGDPTSRVFYDGVVSYGIRRCELDHYLLERTGVARREGRPITDLRREAGHWVLDGELEAPLLVGAGGHFCPVARLLGATPGPGEPTVVARELEFELAADEREVAHVLPHLPELFFEPDLRGYGWVVRKGDFLNVGLGRQDTHGLGAHVDTFLAFLAERGTLPFPLPRAMKGHAYLLHDQSPRPLARDGALLIGDAAGLAYGRSGEGIRPAVESGLLAADAIARHRSFDDRARAYSAAVVARLGERHGRPRPGPSSWIPERWRGALVGRLLASERFARDVVIGRWFLHREKPALRLPRA
jgi:flavin-dependent dehydrogenase